VPGGLRPQDAWRFLLPLCPPLGMLLGWGALMARSWAAAAAVAIALAPAALARQGNELFPVSGVRSKLAADRDPRELYLERSLDHYRPYEYIRRSIPADSRVLLYREVRSYWLGLDYRWGDPLNQAVIPYAALSSPEELRAALAREGITHVLVNDELAMYGPSQRYYDERALALMDGVLKRHADPPGKFGPISLYRLR
ncbi:MAG: hypothetical protein HY925_00705, partial [Elusimicrobia bacterium]|nr:hypothetical protein [Elusimicrobiota bacterium]